MKLAYITSTAMTQTPFLEGQNAYMQARGFELHSITSPGPYLDRLVARDGVIPHPVAIERTIAPFRDLVSLFRLIAMLRRVRPTVVHLSSPKGALLGSIASWIARVPVRIYFVRGLRTEAEQGLRRALFRRIEWLTARLCHQTICVAPSLLEFARAEGILGPNEGMILAHGMSNGVDSDRFEPDSVSAADLPPDWSGEELLVIGFVGRVARDKGLHELYEAWTTLREEFSEARLLIVGPWEETDPVAPEVRAGLESDPRVLLAGRQADVAPYYKRMSVFAFPSHGTEGFPNSPMEAAAMGLPVVASRVVGCVDAVVDGVTGTIVPVRDSAALTDALRKYLADPELRRDQGLAGRDRVRRDFRREPIWEALYQVYCHQLQRAVPGQHGELCPAERTQ